MTCEAFGGLLDALMDGELTDKQRREMEAHAAECPDCAAALRATVQLKALFDDMEPEVDVPLAAQAQWRNAVREEAAKKRRGRFVRWACAAAAAIVVLVGVGLALNMQSAPKLAGDATLVATEMAVEKKAAPEAIARNAVEYDAGANAVVEADGAMDYAPEAAVEMEAFEADMAEDVEEATEAAASGIAIKQAPACEVTLRAKDVDTVCSRISDLAKEYEGEADVQRVEDGSANLYVTIDAGDAGDFLNAVVPMDESGTAVKAPDVSGEGAVPILITLLPVA